MKGGLLGFKSIEMNYLMWLVFAIKNQFKMGTILVNNGFYLLHQQAISTNRLKQHIGQPLTILIEQPYDEGWSGRSYADAPDIDGLVFIKTDEILQPGQFVDTMITDSDEYDLYAELI